MGQVIHKGAVISGMGTGQGQPRPVAFRVHGPGRPERLADLLCLSDLHVYLTAPFVPSWSLFNALACGCVVLASDVDPVREIIEPGVTGLVAPLFDIDYQAQVALRVLDDPAAHASLRKAGRQADRAAAIAWESVSRR